MNNCNCDNCVYCKGYLHSTRKGFHCYHPNQKYIMEYFDKHNISKMAGFIGFGANFSNVPANKTTPKWCPKTVESEEGE